MRGEEKKVNQSVVSRLRKNELIALCKLRGSCWSSGSREQEHKGGAQGVSTWWFAAAAR